LTSMALTGCRGVMPEWCAWGNDSCSCCLHLFRTSYDIQQLGSVWLGAGTIYSRNNAVRLWTRRSNYRNRCLICGRTLSVRRMILFGR